MPNMGINMPNMGINESTATAQINKHTSLSDALFTLTQQRVLGYLFGQPERSFFATELISLTGAGSGAVQRELKRLAESGLVLVTRMGNQKHYQANPASPVFSELSAMVQKTFGLADPLRTALMPLTDMIDAAFVFGSVAKRTDTASSDIDLMVVSDTLGYADLYAVLESTAASLGRAINPTVYSRQQIAKRVAENNAFLQRVLAQPKVWVIGGEHDLGA
jgi:predicted nucleotidyltransferase